MSESVDAYRSRYKKDPKVLIWMDDAGTVVRIDLYRGKKKGWETKIEGFVARGAADPPEPIGSSIVISQADEVVMLTKVNQTDEMTMQHDESVTDVRHELHMDSD